MNTLKCKVLLKNSFLVFAAALGIYLLITLPTLMVPPMYMLSAWYALSFGWIAGLLFMILFALIARIQTSFRRRILLVYLLVALSVLLAFECMELTGTWPGIWDAGVFLLFPASAVAAGWLSVRLMRRRIQDCFLLFAEPAKLPYQSAKYYDHV